MRTSLKRIFSALSIFALVLTLLGNVTFFASAEELAYTPSDAYVLNFGGHGDKVYIYAQFSPFVPKLHYDGMDVDGYSIIFGLYDTVNEEPFELLYCTDLPVDAVDANYRRVNLSDSTYASEQADLLRAIVMHTYPYLTVEEVAADSGIADLTLAEAISGSQAAIWSVAHGDNVDIVDFLSAVVTGNSRDSVIQRKLNQERLDYYDGDDTYKAGIKENIAALYDYLVNLEPMEAKKILVSESAFVEKDTMPTVTDNGDGICDVTVHTKVNVCVEETDNLVLTAFLANGKYAASLPLSDGINDCSLTISNVPAQVAQDTVTLAIDGVQDALEDAYLFDAQGIRGNSQSMIGARSGALPVHAETKVEPDRVLHIVKTDGEKNPLQNVSFEVYYVGSVEDLRDGKLDIGAKPTDADVKKYAVSTRMVGTLTTDKNGKASLNFGTEDGVYLVKELPNPAVEEEIAPFFVSLPDYSRFDDNGAPLYEITARPKNTPLIEKPEIEKDVTSIGNKSDSFAVGQAHRWIVRTSVPKTIATGQEYVITDTLDYRLSYQGVEKVELVYCPDDSPEETRLTLTLAADYTVTAEKSQDADGHSVDVLTVSLTGTGMKKIAAAAGENTADCELRTWFIAKINQNAQMGVEIPNRAEITYVNQIGSRFENQSDAPEVHTGGAQLLKVSATDRNLLLSGAQFTLYRMATQEEIAAGTYDAELTIGQTRYKMVTASFYDNAAMQGEPVTSVTTGEAGTVCFYGLAYGTYYLVETQAPAGYNKLAAPKQITIGAQSHTLENRITVTNTSGTELPSTGGTGTTVLTTVGAIMVGVAAVILITRKRITGENL